MFKYVGFLLLPLLVGMSGEPEFPLRKIIGKGLVWSESLQYHSDSANAPGGEVYHFYSNVSPEDSVTVIAEEKKEVDGQLYHSCAFIIHNKHSDSHETFSVESIERWNARRQDEAYKNELAAVQASQRVRQVDSALLEQVGEYWVHVEKYKGEFYLHEDWSGLIAYRLTSNAFFRINMETMINEVVGLSGNRERFVVKFPNWELYFKRIDSEREVYQMEGLFGKDHKAYVIPVRRIHDFKLIAYCNNTGDLIVPFVKWDRE